MSYFHVEVCANCGKESNESVKLKNCTACRLVKYCSVDCQRAHRKKHKKACKKRVAELKDERLYSQGQERPERDFCPICTLPIPIPMEDHSIFKVCCMKRVCRGCEVAACKKGMFDCAFCRTPRHENDESAVAMTQKRVDAKDPEALHFLGDQYYSGRCGLQENAARAINLWKEAVELGSIDAHFNLGHVYLKGKGVAPDEAMAIQHWESAAMKGHVEARSNLGAIEYNKGNDERAVRHHLIAAKLGDKTSLDNIKDMFIEGVATKTQYTEALKGYQESVDEMKSPERDEAKKS